MSDIIIEEDEMSEEQPLENNELSREQYLEVTFKEEDEREEKIEVAVICDAKNDVDVGKE